MLVAMPVITCPHCGARSITIVAWVDLDHCRDCGKPLGRRDPRASETEIREQLYQRKDASEAGRPRRGRDARRRMTT
jgi:hypothetical protein